MKLNLNEFEFEFELQTARHGFPHQPTALAYDPIQRLVAIGTKSGAVRMYPFINHSNIMNTKLGTPLPPPTTTHRSTQVKNFDYWLLIIDYRIVVGGIF